MRLTIRATMQLSMLLMILSFASKLGESYAFNCVFRRVTLFGNLLMENTHYFCEASLNAVYLN